MRELIGLGRKAQPKRISIDKISDHLDRRSLAILTGFKPEDFVDRAKIYKCCAQKDDAKIAPSSNCPHYGEYYQKRTNYKAPDAVDLAKIS